MDPVAYLDRFVLALNEQACALADPPAKRVASWRVVLNDKAVSLDRPIRVVANEQPRVPAGSPHGGEFAGGQGSGGNVSLPTDISKLKLVGTLQGSTVPKLMEDATGKKWVVKNSTTEAHTANEALADKLYSVLGVPTPRSGVFPGGKVSEYIEGAQTLSKWKQGKSAAEVDAMHREIGKHFVADALMSNWDSVGLTQDNVIVKDGKPVRIDNGGALKYRAQGAPKGAAFGTKVGEIESMRNADKNPSAAEVFGHLTQPEIRKQALDVLTKKDAVLSAIDDPQTKKIMEGRFADLAYRFQPTSPAPTPVAAPVPPPAAPAGIKFSSGSELASFVGANKGSVKFTQLHLDKVAFLNPGGIANGTFFMAKTPTKQQDDEQAAQLMKVLPAGTKIVKKDVKAHQMKAAGQLPTPSVTPKSPPKPLATASTHKNLHELYDDYDIEKTILLGESIDLRGRHASTMHTPQGKAAYEKELDKIAVKKASLEKWYEDSKKSFHATPAPTPAVDYSGKSPADIAGWSAAEGTSHSMQSYGTVMTRKGPGGQTQVLLRKPKNNFDGYHWSYPKGTSSPGEKPLDTALKETLEETGHTVKITGHIPELFSSSGSKKNGFFLAESVSRDPLKMDGETRETKWVDIDKAHLEIAKTTNLAGRARDLKILASTKKALGLPDTISLAVVPKATPSAPTAPKAATTAPYPKSTYVAKPLVGEQLKAETPEVASNRETVLNQGTLWDKKAHQKWADQHPVGSLGYKAVSQWKMSASGIRDDFANTKPGQEPTYEASRNLKKLLDSGMEHDGIVYRGIGGSSARELFKVLQKQGVGSTYSDPAPHCMSPNIAVANKFSSGDVVFRIHTKTGVPVQKVDGYGSSGTSSGDEMEVIGKPGVKYLVKGFASDVVLKSEKGGSGHKVKHFIDLEEVK